jgi:hypothetical protein
MNECLDYAINAGFGDRKVPKNIFQGNGPLFGFEKLKNIKRFRKDGYEVKAIWLCSGQRKRSPLLI